jgi:hypothetical protein
MDGPAPPEDATRPDPSPSPRMDIQPRREASPPPRDRAASGRGGGGIVGVVSRWRPIETPRFTSCVLLYLLGIFVAFYATPPVTITDAMQTKYFDMMEAADAIDLEPRTAAETALYHATMDVRRARNSQWFCWSSAPCRARVNKAKARQRAKLRDAEVYRKRRDAKVREAKRTLGLWSALGVDEAKALFRDCYERGKVFATRNTYYDTFWLIIGGRSDDSLAELLIRWGFTVLSNFTVGMASAVISFAWRLPALIRTFAAGTWSGLVFFGVATIRRVLSVQTFFTHPPLGFNI